MRRQKYTRVINRQAYTVQQQKQLVYAFDNNQIDNQFVNYHSSNKYSLASAKIISKSKWDNGNDRQWWARQGTNIDASTKNHPHYYCLDVMLDTM